MTAETPEKVPPVFTAGLTSTPPARASMRCKAMTKAGLPCPNNPQLSTGLCFAHDPACRLHLSEAGRKGQRELRRRRYEAAAAEPTITLTTTEDAAALIASTTDKLLKGEVDRATANATFYGVQVFLRTINLRDQERRIEALESAAKARK